MACNGIFKYCLRGMLGSKQHETLYFFFDTITFLLADFRITPRVEVPSGYCSGEAGEGLPYFSAGTL